MCELAKRTVAAGCLAPGGYLRKVHTAESILEIAHLRNVLEAEGIACVIRNERLGGCTRRDSVRRVLAGALGGRERCTLLKARGADRGRARAPVRRVASDWTCERCGECREAQFDACWRCTADDLRELAAKHDDANDEQRHHLTIARRFNGPPDSGNGGYSCGAFAVATRR